MDDQAKLDMLNSQCIIEFMWYGPPYQSKCEHLNRVRHYQWYTTSILKQKECLSKQPN